MSKQTDSEAPCQRPRLDTGPSGAERCEGSVDLVRADPDALGDLFLLSDGGKLRK